MTTPTIERSFADQLAALPEEVQAQLLSIVDFVVGLDPMEKFHAAESMHLASRTRSLPEPARMLALLAGSTVYRIGESAEQIRSCRDVQPAAVVLAEILAEEGTD